MRGQTYGCGISHQTFVMESSRVILTGGDYDPCDDDPCAGSDYECEGTVMRVIEGNEYPMKVEWDNGTTNEYHPHNLEIIGEIELAPPMEEDNPNKTFRARKWSKTVILSDLVTSEATECREITSNSIKKVMDKTSASISTAKYILNFFNGNVEEAIAQLTKPTHIGTNQHATTENENNALPIQTVQTGINRHATTENSDEIPPNIGGIVIDSVVAHNPLVVFRQNKKVVFRQNKLGSTEGWGQGGTQTKISPELLRKLNTQGSL